MVDQSGRVVPATTFGAAALCVYGIVQWRR
jgi:hypothetical protein